jgi:hypothetical protein
VSSSSAVVRRTAAVCVSHICRESKNCLNFIVWSLKLILGRILPLNECDNSDQIVGSVIAFRHIIQVVDTDFTNPTLVSLLTLCFEVCIVLCCHKSSVVVTASLETLLQLTKLTLPSLEQVLTRKHGISRALVNECLPPEDESEPSTNEDTLSLMTLDDNTSLIEIGKRPSIVSTNSGDCSSVIIASSGYSSSEEADEDLPDKLKHLTLKNSDSQENEDDTLPLLCSDERPEEPESSVLHKTL